MPLIFTVIKWLWTSLSIIFPALLTFIKWFWNSAKSMLQPLFSFLMDNWLKVLIFWVFWAIALNLTSSLIAFVLYHISVAIHLWLWPYVTPFTVWVLVNFILWIFFLFIGMFINNLLKK